MITKTSEMTPRAATIALIATGKPTSESDAAVTASAIAANAVMNSRMSVKP